MSNITEKLISLGGKEWESGKHNRVYFSKEVFIEYAKKNGIDFEFASCDGIHDAIKRISTKAPDCKAWFNVATNKFESKKPSIQHYFDSYVNVNQEEPN